MIRHNSCLIVGNLGGAPVERARSEKSGAVVTFSVAENVRSFDPENGTFKTTHTNWFPVTAFGPVAERARALGLTSDEAKSWGLNRALFYAAAKRGWERAREIGAKRAVITEFAASVERRDPVYVLGGEKAFRVRDTKKGLRFRFGAEVQTPEDFDWRVKRRFGEDWNEAWAEAVSIIRGSSRRDLDIQSRFYNTVYKPRRDLLAERWSALGQVSEEDQPKAA